MAAAFGNRYAMGTASIELGGGRATLLIGTLRRRWRTDSSRAASSFCTLFLVFRSGSTASLAKASPRKLGSASSDWRLRFSALHDAGIGTDFNMRAPYGPSHLPNRDGEAFDRHRAHAAEDQKSDKPKL